MTDGRAESESSKQRVRDTLVGRRQEGSPRTGRGRVYAEHGEDAIWLHPFGHPPRDHDLRLAKALARCRGQEGAFPALLRQPRCREEVSTVHPR